jgi:hypothetical protein
LSSRSGIRDPDFISIRKKRLPQIFEKDHVKSKEKEIIKER